MATFPTAPCGARMMSRLERLAACTEEPPALTRTYLTPQHRAAGELIAGWMREAGMGARMDAVGNVVGRYEGTRPGAPALLVGSHFDTVRNAGKYDGTLGVIAGIDCAAVLHDARERLEHALEVVAFADEEGVRFGATLLGSRALAGTFDPAVLTRTDSAGISMGEAMRAYGLDPDAVAAATRAPRDLAAFVEVHIEQGPVLEGRGEPVGIVTSIAGATRLQVEITGLAGHAGTVPMDMRRDAAAAAAEAVLLVEARCRREPGLVGTVGVLEVPLGATNVIPGSARFTVDLRAGTDAVRVAAVADVIAGMQALAERRGVGCRWVSTHEASAVGCAPWLMARLEAAARGRGLAAPSLPSGAGHDAMALADLTDIGMLFVRCGNGGISHHPDETLRQDDAALAAAVLLDFLRAFSPRPGGRP